MLRKIRIAIAGLPLCFALILGGCGGGQPDPRENPDFNEEVLDNPGAVELAPPS